ncbi:hypothetical protein AGDE_14674 [Angomonas deanei]|nr:hypothetical protein AGDE_14674 [Angomonas deanei]|eukprot:EPY20438.1 hypothetical protein AGDE_14674 [Angomonas deanei]
MEVEQLLLHEQKKTMKVQRHQLLLMRDRLADGGEEEGTAVAEGGEPARRDSDPHWESARVRPDDGVSVPATEPPAHLRAVYARMRQEPFDTDDQYASLYMQPSTAVNREAPPASEKSDNEQNNDSNHPSNEENENATESANREEVP